MKITKGNNEYACVFLQPGYWETGVLSDFFQAGASEDRTLPAYFWTDNCDFDSVANCYVLVLTPLHDKTRRRTTRRLRRPSISRVNMCSSSSPKEPLPRPGRSAR